MTSLLTRFSKPQAYVVVEFYPWFKCSFLFLGMVIYDNEFKARSRK